MKEKKDKMPSFLDKVSSVIKDTKRWIFHGAESVTKEEFMRRTKICNECPHFIHKSNTCGICGCWMEVKAKWKTSECPKRKWGNEADSKFYKSEKN